MNVLDLVAYLFGGLFLANALPHFVSGCEGRPFQSPFATPRGEGLSSSLVNVLWGFANFVVAYLLLCKVGAFDLHDLADAAVFGIGVLAMACFHAQHFGRFHGGRSPGGLHGAE